MAVAALGAAVAAGAASASGAVKCAHCGATDGLKRCSVCKAVHYCNVTCQKADLKRHRAADGCGSSSSSASAAGTSSTLKKSAAAALGQTVYASGGANGGLPATPAASPVPAFRAAAAGIGSAAVPAAQAPSVASSASSSTQRRRVEPPASGPACLRCGGGLDTSYSAVVACRSIFDAEQCPHKPFCSHCAARLERQTLGFCPCGALIVRVEETREKNDVVEHPKNALSEADAPHVPQAGDAEGKTPATAASEDDLERLD
eukprot:TRINITY_DN45678_c0_g1_i1.p1 TRINITY_DN45678_c0_g1~~TRINITY_DN45678_c0_g1_i1.p1  ORF type:complete len:260 (-),score=59.56 TRINITY_DN45678_c0_g1_i1:92-871(-)